MEVMEDKDKHMVTESTNRKKLLEEVEALVVSFSSLLDTYNFVCLSVYFPFPYGQSKNRIQERWRLTLGLWFREVSIRDVRQPFYTVVQEVFLEKFLRETSRFRVKLLRPENMMGLMRWF